MLAASRPTLVVIDALTGALTLHGLDPNSGREVELFSREVIDPLRAHGAAVVMLDHLVKDPERRGRFSIGSERKLAAVDVHLGLELLEPLSRGGTGRAILKTHKDRPGHLPRPDTGVLEVISHAATGAVTGKLHAPGTPTEKKPFRPTRLMEKASRFLEAQAAPVSSSKVLNAIGGNADAARLAIDLLITEHYVGEQPGARNARNLTNLAPFRESRDAPTSTTSTNPDQTSTKTGSRPTSTTSTNPLQGSRWERTRSDRLADTTSTRSSARGMPQV